MSISLHVELPTFSHSFQVSVSSSATIVDVKHEIHKTCTGGPRVSGQRLIWRGRFLGDEEKVQDIWKSPDDARIVHLAVHPSSWTAPPPGVTPTSPSEPRQPSFGIPAAPPPSPVPHNLPLQPTPTRQIHVSEYPASPQRMPLASPPQPSQYLLANLKYVAYKHQNAILALTEGRVLSNPPPGIDALRQHAMNILAQMGYVWPSVFDEEFPPAQDESVGVKYEPVTIDNQDYLSLVRSSGAPTPLQSHALRVLARTFPILLIPPQRVPLIFSPSMPTQAVPLPVNLNGHLQQLGLPPLRARQPNPVVAELRAIQLRALAAPLLLLTLRALFLLYFFSPFQKPVFGIIVSAWLLYEAWNTIRNAMPRVAIRNAGANGVPPQGPAANQAQVVDAQAQPQAQQRQQQQQRAQPHRPHPDIMMERQRPHTDILIDRVANINLQEESSILNGRGGPETEPTISHRLKTFVQLLFLTMHPAVWDRRRVALRRREGALRTETNARRTTVEPLEEGEDVAAHEARVRASAQLATVHAGRPQWVKEYIERVGRGEWVDE
ncbi:hypothetical protein BV25DRAFT_1910650 [Artomyces pyxidatus]|uniref:Uncharacterized protein n=1 Tax=Artomyces pyxidatus TaxID=48021 RepID=A0ACB8TKL5_9AGAM|nr:hypothetical protein BV25DRAFT_1910650 [Artomyces pyxidatus]